MPRPPAPFQPRIGRPRRGDGFAQDGWFAWCGSATQGRDGRWHLFASRWPAHLPFFAGYKVASEIVRAEAERPEGPYRFAEVVLGDRGERWWDGRMTHNPVVLAAGGRWYLFYIGATYAGPRPGAADLAAERSDAPRQSYASIAIGCAVADRPEGPWRRPDEPCLRGRPGAWDDRMVTNPAPCVRPDGGVLLLYRGNLARASPEAPFRCALGVAVADAPGAPFRRLRDDPLFFGDLANRIEDPCVWWNGTAYELIAKDLTGNLAGRHGDGIHAWSADGVDWRLCDPPRAWSRDLAWSDGSTTSLGSMERPQVVRDVAGRPTHLVCAMGDDSGEHLWRGMRSSWTQVVPLHDA